MQTRQGRSRFAPLVAPIICALVVSGASPQPAEAASAKASCAPAPSAAAKRLMTRAARHVRRAKRLRRAGRTRHARGRHVRARKALRASRRHRRVARRLRSRARVCGVAARKAKRNPTTPPPPDVANPNAAVGVEGGIRWRAGADLVDTVARLRAAGATHTRESIAWYRVEPNRGQWTFSEIDPGVAEAARQGLRITALLDSPPAWATGTTDRSVAPVEGQALADYANYARNLVERYGTNGTFWAANPQLPKLPIVEWDVWNEPYMRAFWHNTGAHAWPDPEGYAQMFRAVVSEARKADPNAKFMAEVEISTTDANNEPFLSRMFDAVPDLASYMDIASNHPYVHTDGRSPAECNTGTTDTSNRYNFCRVKTIRRILDREGATAAKLWLTEFGYSTCGSCGKWQVSEATQAQYVHDAFSLLRQWDVADGFIWWVYKSSEASPGAEDWMGLVHRDGSPKPAWAAFSAEARLGL